MDLKTKINLLLARVQGKVSKNSVKVLEAVLSTTDTGTYAIPGYTLVVAKRNDLEQPLRGIFRNADSPRGFVIGPASIDMLDPNREEAIEIMKFLIKWNDHIKEKHASRYKEARRNGGPRVGRRNTDKGDDSSN